MLNNIIKGAKIAYAYEKTMMKPKDVCKMSALFLGVLGVKIATD